MKQMIAVYGGALAIYIVIVMLIAVGPAIDLSQTPPGPGVKPLTALQKEGRQVYAGNGCGYCHTQQVRPLPEDSVFGRPSAPGDFAYQTPELLGSERTGPDLTNVGKRKPSKVWQYIHLYDPRAVVPASIMPNFKFLFRVVQTVPEGETAVPIPAKYAPAHGKVIPTQKAKALVAYLLSLKQTPIPGYKMNGGMGGRTMAAQPEATPASSGTSTNGGYSFNAAKGKSLYVANCAACHQANGAGLLHAFPPLKGNPAVVNPDPTTQIHAALFGVKGKTIEGIKYGSAMPPFKDQLSDTEIANILNYERSSWGNHAKHITPDQVATIRAGKKLNAASGQSVKSKAAPQQATKASAYTFVPAKGQALYTAHCAACHQASGEGLPGAFPPLKGDLVVNNANPTEHIETVLHGAHGRTIGGVKYGGTMPPFAGQLGDTDIATIINHERSSWGNHAKLVTPSQVAAIRAKGQ